MLQIKDLHSSSFDIATLDNKLTCMAMIRALGPEYSNFVLSLALLTDLDKDKVKAAFQTEEINQCPHSDAISTPPADSALSASSSSCPIDLSLGKEAPGREASKLSCNSATLMILTMHGN